MHFLQPIRNDICSKYFAEYLLSRHSGSICREKLPAEYKNMMTEYGTHWFLGKSPNIQQLALGSRQCYSKLLFCLHTQLNHSSSYTDQFKRPDQNLPANLLSDKKEKTQNYLCILQLCPWEDKRKLQ